MLSAFCSLFIDVFVAVLNLTTVSQRSSQCDVVNMIYRENYQTQHVTVVYYQSLLSPKRKLLFFHPCLFVNKLMTKSL